MTDITLLIGNKNYSSWSLRGWLAVRHAGIAFTEDLVPLDLPDTKARWAGRAPAGLVPVLIEDGVSIWDSLAIIERAHELAPDAGMWPADPMARAIARSVSAEMHSGFGMLRSLCPMNLRRAPQAIAEPDKISADVARFEEIVSDCRARFAGDDGPFMFGAFCGADVMYAPLATRLRTYCVGVSDETAAYVDAIHAHPLFVEWKDAGVQESWVIDADEV